MSPKGHVYPYVYRQYCSHCHPLAPCIHMLIDSTAATVNHWPRVSKSLTPALQTLSHTGHVYPYVYRQYCSHCHPLATCIHMCIASTAATVTHSPRVSICVSPALQPLSHTGHVDPYVYCQHCSHCHPLATCIHMCIASTAATVTHWPRVSICVSPLLQRLSPTDHVYPQVYRQYCSHCHPMTTCNHMCIGCTAATVTHWPRVSLCVSAALQPLSHNGDVYPYMYRQYCSHCHSLSTCIHMCIDSTAATVTH